MPAVALNDDVPRGRRQVERVGLLPQVARDDRVAVVRGETHFLAHGVLVLEVAEVHFADVDAEVADGGEHEQGEEASERAGAASWGHHWDCAPSMRSLTMRLIASRRPPASSRSAYSPSARRPFRSKIVLPVVWSTICTSTMIWSLRRDATAWVEVVLKPTGTSTSYVRITPRSTASARSSGASRTPSRESRSRRIASNSSRCRSGDGVS